MVEINRRKANLSVAVDPHLLYLTESTVNDGEFSSVSNAVQTILSEYDGRWETYSKNGQTAAFFNQLFPDDDKKQASGYGRSSRPRKVPLTVSLNPETRLFIREISEISGKNNSEIVSAVLRHYFGEEQKKRKTVSEEKETYVTEKDGAEVIRVPEKDLGRFVAGQIEERFRKS